jgi:hypothetical protein
MEVPEHSHDLSRFDIAALAAVTATSALSLDLRVAFLRRPPAGDVGHWN